MKKTKKGYFVKGLILLVAVSGVCWDIARSSLAVVEGTFRYESEFDAVSGATATVSIVTSDYDSLSNPVDRNTDPDYAQIEEMVGKAIELQGGLEWVVEKGDVVLIKVNLVGGNSPSGAGENTDVRVVKALMRHIHQYTEGEVTLQIAEGTARSNDDPMDSESVWGNSGYLELVTDPQMEGIDFSFVNLNQGVEDLVEVDLGKDGTAALMGGKFHVHRAQLEADVYMAVPVLKIHNTGITNTLKLQIGTAPGCYYGYNKMKGSDLFPEGLHHDVEHRRWTTEEIVDLCNIADIDFVVVDAVMCLESFKTNKDYNQVRFNTILAGADPVAVDHVAAKLMCLNPDDIAHITLAEKVGLGTNNAEQIILEGVPLEQARKRVKKSDTEEGHFGQSNRTWILSPAFETTDFDKQHYADEAMIEPLPGQDGWTEPVYFFDDRIDLHSFYQGAGNIVSYAFSYFYAEEAGDAELWVGGEEGLSVYLNGQEVYRKTSYSPYPTGDLGDNEGIVQVKEGRNTLLVKSQQKYGDYSFALNICEVESNKDYYGNRLPGLKFYIDDSGAGVELLGVTSGDIDSPTAIRCYPNPATDLVHVTFSLSHAQMVKAGIYDLSGRLIRSMESREYPAGEAQLTWNLEDGHGSRVRSGVYLCRLEYGLKQKTVRMVVQ